MAINRRKFLQLLGAGTAAAALPPSISRALAIPPRRRTGTITDVEHIVILMQENRSFDHYFGSLKGVRGFGDPHPVLLPSGNAVWYQPNGDGYVLPFHPSAPQLGSQFMQDLPHGWTDTHAAWNVGKYDEWVPSKGTTTMAYLTRDDIPFHYALADAFTICDAYHCSLMGPTDPNRYYMWTGWVGNDGKGGGPVVDNAEAGYDWHTFPERLQQAGITWKIYQDVGAGLDAAHASGWGDDAYIGNYGDNSLLYFHQYQTAEQGSPLYQGAVTGTNISQSGSLFDIFRNDVSVGKLPQVSWIVAPEAYTEHPNWPANYGAWYISQILDALTANPDVWSKTALFLTYDENDGFFDHVVPPTPPQSRAQGQSTVATTSEIFPGSDKYAAGPYGLGVRVPMLVISPWSKGGWVTSEVFDHTSLIKFIERRFAHGHPQLIESNITPWRRAVVGDLTSAFDFSSGSSTTVSLPSTSSYAPPDAVRHPDYQPDLPSDPELPTQEPGVRPARALPYELQTSADVDASGNVTLHFRNTGGATAVFQVRSADGKSGPWSYTVSPNASLSDTWPMPSDQNAYDLAVYGPNGFLRSFRGGANGTTSLDVQVNYQTNKNALGLKLHNRGNASLDIQVWDEYAERKTLHELQAGRSVLQPVALDNSYGWYDMTIEISGDAMFMQRIAGHLETGDDSMSDPAFGRA